MKQASRVVSDPREPLFVFHHFSILALGFTNLAMLGWLAAAAAPLLIHLWSRHRFRESPWAAMQFLLAAMHRNARRLRLQQWLLLALRTALIALVVLAVAEPYGGHLVAGKTSTPAHKVIVIDGSVSMAYRDDMASNFERAKKLAADLVHGGRAGNTFTVILMTTPAEIIVGNETVDVSAVSAQIQSLAQTHAPADLPGAIALVEQALADQSKDGNIARRQEVYFLTDLQLATWRLMPSEISELAERAALFIIDVGQPDAANLAVTRLASSEPFVIVNREMVWDVTLRQFGPQLVGDCRVELLVDDVAVGEQTIDVPGGGEANIRFSHRFTSPGSHTLAIRAAGDRLEPDSARWLVVPVREEIRVLCVEGKEGAAKYVAEALNPDQTTSAIRPVVASEGELTELNLADFDCVFLCNVPQFTESEAQRLARYAADGGGIVFFLGDRVVPESYNRLVKGQRAAASPPPLNPAAGDSQTAIQSQPLLPARIGELVAEPQFGLDPLDYRHAIVAPFRGNERAGLLTTPVSRYYRLELPKQLRNIEVAATIRRGDPFIVAAPLGKGRTVLVATDGSLSSVDPTTGEPWTVWPTWPSFLPIVRELLAYAVSGKHQEWQQPVGTPLASPVVSDAGSTLRILRPDGTTAPVALHDTQGERQWSFSDTRLAGIYALAGQTQEASQRFALNVDTRESDLTRIDTRQLSQVFVVRNLPPSARDEPTALLA
ncbi:MAG TPA: BatA domain-containing protein, partial [Lacipirellulaceae bacterium]